MRYIGDLKIQTEKDAENYLLNGPLKSYGVNGFGSYLIVVKDLKVAVGMCSLIKRNWLPAPDLGYALLPEYTGNGYAFEAAARCLQDMFDNQTEEMEAVVSPDNKKSALLLEKLGFKLTGTIVAPDTNEELLRYKQNRKKL